MPSSVLVKYRQDEDISQKELAEEIGINPAVLLRVEKNIGNYTVRKILLWCRKKGISPFDVYPPDASA